MAAPVTFPPKTISSAVLIVWQILLPDNKTCNGSQRMELSELNHIPILVCPHIFRGRIGPQRRRPGHAIMIAIYSTSSLPVRPRATTSLETKCASKNFVYRPQGNSLDLIGQGPFHELTDLHASICEATDNRDGMERGQRPLDRCDMTLKPVMIDIF